MRIGIIAPPWLPVPPCGYGGTELVVHTLAKGLLERGHDVQLFTVGTSTCPVPRQHLFDRPAQPLGDVVAEAAHVLAAYENLADCDVVHDHTVIGALVGAAMGAPPGAVTNHGPYTPLSRRIFAAVARHAAVVAISHDQARSAPPVPVTAVIHHGLDLADYPSGAGDGDYLLFVGRMSPEKGAHRALRIARRAGWRLVIATKMWEPRERAYYLEQVEPLLGPDISVVHDPDPNRKVDLLGGAHAMLNPITWPEPFGLVMIEALACGTPVLTYARGAAPEIVDHAGTGFLCVDEADMTRRVADVATLQRQDCRAAVQARFSMARLAEDHERLYAALLRSRGDPPAVTPVACPV
ncbi:glycosyltransferase family 4 protein [Terrabacter sp. MAHUQ-38]|uniref:glycosyltransferase family 4 protein n=1 Tax=unclassified Terrabacter TaxID=2630222 RepID=UPI00165E894D|nr:glycosyltransferase family 4 protein [Terrabacter sp. MAHUQ-38]MBC9821216.1 glycosyltransferase family 4 protein [Terrabacter sp. MAHUQ-38]